MGSGVVVVTGARVGAYEQAACGYTLQLCACSSFCQRYEPVSVSGFSY